MKFPFRRRQHEELDEEISSHLRMATLDRQARGESAEMAESSARRELGNIGLVKETTRNMWGFRSIEILWRDLRFGGRLLSKQPGFSIAAIVALALGIGANTAVFSVINAVLIRPLPLKDSDRLVAIWETNSQRGQNRGDSGPGNFTDWKNRNIVFEDVAAYFNWTYNLTGTGEPERLQATIVTGSFFQLTGAQPAMGRILLPSDDQSDSQNVVILSHGLWNRRFGGDSSIVGKTVTLNQHTFTVIGVMPASFTFPDPETDLWAPLGFSAARMQDRNGKFLKVIARLKPNVRLKQAQAEMDTIANQLQAQYPTTNSGSGVRLVSLLDDEVRQIKPALLVLWGAVGLVLLIACANVANLLLSRGATRQREFAVRTALGASRTRLVIQLLSESLLLAIAGGFLGILLAAWSAPMIARLGVSGIPRLSDSRVDLRALGFTFVISAVTALIFGLAPALSVTQTTIQDSLKEGIKGSSGKSNRKIRDLFVISEVAFSVVLLIGAGLMLRSFIKLQNVDLGFDSSNLLAATVNLPGSKYGQNFQQINFFDQAIQRIQSVAGVESVGAVQDLPVRANSMSYTVEIEGQGKPANGAEPSAGYRVVTRDYFKTMRIRLVAGREFTDYDDSNASPVLIVNQSMVRQFWPNESPIGKRIKFGDDLTKKWFSIVGVVSDIKHMGLDADEGPALYQPIAQKTFSYLTWMTFVVRAKTDQVALIASIKGAIQSLDKDQPVYEVTTMHQLIYRSTANPRVTTLLIGIFAFVAVFLSAVGVYALVSYSVSQRTAEIGIRMALGARSGSVLRLVIEQGMFLVLVGVGAGLPGALIVTRTLSGLLYGVTITDPLVFVTVPSIVAMVALLACYFPARRAMKVDPIAALRYE